MEESVVNRGQSGLRVKVLDAGLCTGCGACIDICPYFRTYRGKTSALFPCIVEEGRCFAWCPKVEVNLDELSNRIFGGPYDGLPLGSLKSLKASKAGPEAGSISDAQAGGTVSALVTFALKQGYIKGAVLTDREGLLPLPRYVDSVDDILRCASSKYTAAPTLSAVNRAVAEGRRDIGLVGTPCQVLASALMRSNQLQRDDFVDPFGLVVGLFCTWAVDYRLFEPFIAARISPERVKKIDIPPPPAEIMEIFGEDGTRMECSLEEIRPLVPEGCAYCIDMTSEFSDISVGVMEGRPEMNTLIVRTDRGERIVDEAVSAGFLEISDMPPDNLEHLIWAAGNKKKRALLRARERGIINSGGGKEPSYLLMNAEVLTRLTEEERGR